jgi:hypothetical protein
MIEDGVLLAARHKREGSQIHKHGSGPVLAIESQQGTRRFELVYSQIPTNGGESRAQFFPVASISSVAETAEPVVAVRLTDGCAGANHLPALAPPVPRGTDVIQPAKGRRSVNAAKNRESAEREGNWSRRNLRHERNRKGLQVLVERLQSALTTDGVAEQHRQKIDHLIAAKTLPGKAHLLIDQASNTVLVKIPADQYDFSKPRRGRDGGLRSRLDFHRTIGDTYHTWTSLLRTVVFFLIKEAYFYAGWLPVTPHCASRGKSSARVTTFSTVKP